MSDGLKVFSVAVAPTERPKDIVIIFINSFSVFYLFLTALSLINYQHKTPTRGAASGRNKHIRIIATTIE